MKMQNFSRALKEKSKVSNQEISRAFKRKKELFTF